LVEDEPVRKTGSSF